MGAIPLVIEVDGREYTVEADHNETLFEVLQRTVPENRWGGSPPTTSSGITVDPSRLVRDIVRDTNETRFVILSRGDQGGIPLFPKFLRDVEPDSPKWPEREKEEIIRMEMLNRLVRKNNPGFAYTNPKFYEIDEFKVVNGWIKTILGPVSFKIILSDLYPLEHPEASLSGKFFDEYMKCVYIHTHTFYPLNVRIICGDQKFLRKWSGKYGVAHYISRVLFTWIILESQELSRIMDLPEPYSDLSLSEYRQMVREYGQY